MYFGLRCLWLRTFLDKINYENKNEVLHDLKPEKEDRRLRPQQ